MLLIFSVFNFCFFSDAQKLIDGENFQIYSPFLYVQLQPYFVPVNFPTSCTFIHCFSFYYPTSLSFLQNVFLLVYIALFPVMYLSPPANIASQCKQWERYNRSVLGP